MFCVQIPVRNSILSGRFKRYKAENVTSNFNNVKDK